MGAARRNKYGERVLPKACFNSRKTCRARSEIVNLGKAHGVERLLHSMLFGLPPINIPAFGASIGIILLATVVASAVPAHRATRVDPMVTLRSE